MRYHLLDIPIDGLSKTDAIARMSHMFDDSRSHFVTTPNPEMLVAARGDSAFRSALQAADLALPDGVGLVLVGRAKGMDIPARLSGTDIVDDLCALAVSKGKSVYLLGGEGERVAERAAAVLSHRHPGLRIAGTESGFRTYWADDVTPVIEGDALVRLKAAAPDILFVALGHRKQELWIQKTLPHLPSVRIAMGVGGAFDFIAGDVRRAPRWMRSSGLEWSWRLAIQPWRFKRIWTAVIVFTYLAFFGSRSVNTKTGV